MCEHSCASRGWLGVLRKSYRVYAHWGVFQFFGGLVSLMDSALHSVLSFGTFMPGKAFWVGAMGLWLSVFLPLGALLAGFLRLFACLFSEGMIAESMDM